jgi:hypothetical protein
MMEQLRLGDLLAGSLCRDAAWVPEENPAKDSDL